MAPNTDFRSPAIVLVGSVEPLVEALVEPDALACRSVNNFCSASLNFDPLLLVELTALVGLTLDGLDDGSNEVGLCCWCYSCR